MQQNADLIRAGLRERGIPDDPEYLGENYRCAAISDKDEDCLMRWRIFHQDVPIFEIQAVFEKDDLGLARSLKSRLVNLD